MGEIADPLRRSKIFIEIQRLKPTIRSKSVASVHRRTRKRADCLVGVTDEDQRAEGTAFLQQAQAFQLHSVRILCLVNYQLAIPPGDGSRYLRVST
ncbi:hypothetical protein AWC12_01885 [Mycolicibacterium iranicum]|uniref:Uncharacterized protein n=1 Tax=Mycolicibacterium iranicum TaxID=912594 RepID=A0A1X1X325_MYCIR|nr:hypothetical protein AWC12_01885 [Mycolicibacterium iranicum]